MNLSRPDLTVVSPAMNIILLVSIAGLMLILTSCGGGADGNGGDRTTNSDPAARAVERYLTAKVASDDAALRTLLCSAMEADLPREAASFDSVDARIEGMACQSASSTADGTVVRCEGKIVATYGTEDEDFPLISYRAVQEDGDWKWCGETG
jgi:hypothetical protein